MARAKQATIEEVSTVAAPSIAGAGIAAGTGPTSIPAQPDVEIRTEADPTREYAAAGGLWWWGHGLRTLPFFSDDLTRDFGPEIYDSMTLDAQVSSVLRVLVMAALAQKQTVVPAVQDEENPRATDARKRATFCENCVKGLRTPFRKWLFEMAEGGLKHGHKVAEQLYDYRTFEEGEGVMLALTDLKCKPNEATAFVVDAFNNILGLMYIGPGHPISFLQVQADLGGGTQVKNLEYVIPRSKFAIFTHHPRNGDPRGNSELRQVYQPWKMKQGLWRVYEAFLATYGKPTAYGILAPQKSSIPVPASTAGKPKSEAQAMADGINDMLTKGIGAFPAESQINVLEPKSNGEAFLLAFDLVDRQITKAVLLQTLATEEGVHQARAAAETHQDVLGLVVQHLKTSLEEMVRSDVFAPLIKLNYGDEDTDLVPYLSLGDVEIQDLAQLLTGLGNFLRAGGLHYSQLPDLWKMLGLPEGDVEQFMADMKKEQETIDPALLATDTIQQTGRVIARAKGMQVAGRLGNEEGA